MEVWRGLLPVWARSQKTIPCLRANKRCQYERLLDSNSIIGKAELDSRVKFFAYRKTSALQIILASLWLTGNQAPAEVREEPLTRKEKRWRRRAKPKISHKGKIKLHPLPSLHVQVLLGKMQSARATPETDLTFNTNCKVQEAQSLPTLRLKINYVYSQGSLGAVILVFIGYYRERIQIRISLGKRPESRSVPDVGHPLSPLLGSQGSTALPTLMGDNIQGVVPMRTLPWTSVSRVDSGDSIA